ncbi:hypothetical protein ANCCAN_28966, partial [Ancylostoma caninum]
MAIGNGILSEYLQQNSEIPLQYGRGINGVDDWNEVSRVCSNNTVNPVYYDYSSAPMGSVCYAAQARFDTFGVFDDDAYNMYQDCYQTPRNKRTRKSTKIAGRRRQVALRKKAALNDDDVKPTTPLFTDNNAKSWYGSTDAFHGFPCFNDDSMHTYLNRDDVKAAIHAQLVHKHDWSDCSNLNYHQQKKYYDMSEVIGGI